MAVFGGSYNIDDKGYYTGYNQSGWDSFWNKGTEDEQRYMNEWNTALRQYEQQYALQQEEFALNKDNLLFNQNFATEQLGMQKEILDADLLNMKFNQDLATRQQNLSEESYRSGVLNQARQLQQLGINPASQGGSISGLSMQGGSNVANASAGSASQVSGLSGRSVSGRGAQYQASKIQKSLAKIQAMTAVLDFAQKAQSLKVSQQDADTRSYMAQTDRLEANSDVALNNQRIWSQSMENLDYSSFRQKWSKLGLTYHDFQAIKRVDPATAVALGLSAYLDGQDTPQERGYPGNVSVDQPTVYLDKSGRPNPKGVTVTPQGDYVMTPREYDALQSYYAFDDLSESKKRICADVFGTRQDFVRIPWQTLREWSKLSDDAFRARLYDFRGV